MFYRIKDNLQYLNNIQVLLISLVKSKYVLPWPKMSYLSRKANVISQPIVPNTDDLKSAAISIQGL